MRVLFVNPHYTHDPRTLLLHPPLAYGYMAASLKAAGHEVLHVDLPFEGNSPGSLASCLDDLRPDLVGVTSVAQSYFHALEIAAVVRAWNPCTPVVFGGPHVSFIASECLQRHPAVDYVLLFDAEDSIVELAGALSAGTGPGRLEKVTGLTFRDGGLIRTTAPAPPETHLDRYGQPDRSIFDMAAYLAYDYETVVMTARGCPSRCTFCSTTIAGRTARWNSPRHVVDEIEAVIGLGFSSIFFGDDTFSGDPGRAIAICQEINRRGIDIPWTSNMRAQDARPQVLEAMTAAGAYRVFVGFESVQEKTLRLVKKGTSPARLYKTAARIIGSRPRAARVVHRGRTRGYPGVAGRDAGLHTARQSHGRDVQRDGAAARYRCLPEPGEVRHHDPRPVLVRDHRLAGSPGRSHPGHVAGGDPRLGQPVLRRILQSGIQGRARA